MAKWQPHVLTKEKVSWLFLTCSFEKRHVEDIVLGVDCLRTVGVPDGDIHIFSDQPEKQVILGLYNIIQNVHDLQNFRSVLSSLSGYEFVVLVIGGHGTKEGLEGTNFKIASQELVDCLRTIPEIKAGAVIVGQCYAGLFNYLNVGDIDPQFVIMGSTNLNPSLSDKADLDKPIKSITGQHDLQSWAANIFLLNFFIWIKKPVDVDGDRKKSLLDAYKFAGTHSNEQLRVAKGQLHYSVEVLKSQQMERLMHAPSPQMPMLYLKHMVEVSAAQRSIQQQLDMLYLNQEPWILHSQFARDFTVSW
ncbi:MAG: hypothetical protein ACXVCN_16360 [Bdellovibrio sp.]